MKKVPCEEQETHRVRVYRLSQNSEREREIERESARARKDKAYIVYVF